MKKKIHIPLLNKVYRQLDKQHYGISTTGIHLFLLYASIVIFFIPMVVRLIQVKKIPVAVIPPEFNLSTILVVVSSFLLYQSKALIEKDKIRTLRLSLLTALITGILFIFFGLRPCDSFYCSYGDALSPVGSTF